MEPIRGLQQKRWLLNAFILHNDWRTSWNEMLKLTGETILSVAFQFRLVFRVPKNQSMSVRIGGTFRASYHCDVITSISPKWGLTVVAWPLQIASQLTTADRMKPKSRRTATVSIIRFRMLHTNDSNGIFVKQKFFFLPPLLSSILINIHHVAVDVCWLLINIRGTADIVRSRWIITFWL